VDDLRISPERRRGGAGLGWGERLDHVDPPELRGRPAAKALISSRLQAFLSRKTLACALQYDIA